MKSPLLGAPAPATSRINLHPLRVRSEGRDICTWPILLQKDFWPWNEEQLSRTKTELRILIHRTDLAGSIIAEFPGLLASRGLLQQNRPEAVIIAMQQFPVLPIRG